jgi:hypothetical protein
MSLLYFKIVLCTLAFISMDFNGFRWNPWTITTDRNGKEKNIFSKKLLRTSLAMCILNSRCLCGINSML